MAIELPPLPYDRTALEPHISAETLDYHHGKHHKAYVDNLNKMIEGTEFASMDLVEIIRKSQGAMFNNAAQVWNHTFYWNSMSPSGGGEPTGAIADAIKKSFGSFADFKERFSASAVGHFASGWAWLVKDGDKLEVVDLHDAGNPLTMGKKPILTCDVWEHAYYVDYRNARPKYVEAFWNLVDWDYVSKQMK